MPYGVSIWGPIAASAIGGWISSKRKSSSTPTLDPKYSPLEQQVLSLVQQRLGTSTDLSGYQAQGTQDINHTFDLLKQSQSNDLTARGLSTSPVAGAVDATRENARGGQVSSFINSIPLLRRQLQAQDIGLANGVLGQGRGTTTTEQSGGGAAGSAESIAAMLGYLQSTGAFKRGAGGGGNGQYYEPNDINGWG